MLVYFPEIDVLVSINDVVGESDMPTSKFLKIEIRKDAPSWLDTWEGKDSILPMFFYDENPCGLILTL